MSIRLVDVSAYQGHGVDWQALAGQGIGGGMAKCTEGAGQADETFARNWRAIAEAGLVRALYHLARFDLGNTPQQEAAYLCAHLPPLDAGDVIVMDVEVPTSGPGAYDAETLELGDLLERRTRLVPWLYTGRWYAQGLGRLTAPALARFPLYDSFYVAAPRAGGAPAAASAPGPYSPWSRTTAWQWTNAASYRGIGACDESLFFGSAADFRALGYPQEAPRPPAPPPALPHWQLDVPMHFRPRPVLDSMPLGRLLPAGTRVAEIAPPPGLPVETTHWAYCRTSGDVQGYLLKSNMRPYSP